MTGKAIAFAAFALVMFAANSLLCRMALGSAAIDAASYSTIRVVSGALVLMAIAQWRGRVQTAPDRSTPAFSGGSWISALWLFLYAVPFSFAYTGLTTGTGALILFGCVQLTMLMGAWRSGERPGAAQWAGLTIAAAGLVYLLSPGLEAPPPLPAALMAVAGVSWGIYSLRGRRAGDPLVHTAGNFMRAVPMVVLTSLVVWSVRTEREGVLFAVLSGAVASGLGYVAWYAALKHLSAVRAAIM